MTTVRDPHDNVLRLVQNCRSCQKPIYWGYTINGKRCPYDLNDAGEATDISHFATCPDAKEWSRKDRKR